MKKMKILSLLLVLVTTQIKCASQALQFKNLCQESIKYSQELLTLIQQQQNDAVTKLQKLVRGRKVREDQKSNDKVTLKLKNAETSHELLEKIQKTIQDVKDAKKAVELAEKNWNDQQDINNNLQEKKKSSSTNEESEQLQANKQKLSALQTIKINAEKTLETTILEQKNNFINLLNKYLSDYGTCYKTNKLNSSFNLASVLSTIISDADNYFYISAKNQITQPIDNANELVQAIKDGIMNFGKIQDKKSDDSKDYSDYELDQIKLNFYDLKENNTLSMFTSTDVSLGDVIFYIKRVQDLTEDNKTTLS